MTKSKSVKVVKSATSNRPDPPKSTSPAALVYPTHEWVDMLLDPLNAPAAQIPDEWSFPTQAMKLTMTVDLTTSAAGSLVLFVGASLANFIKTYTVTSENLVVASPGNTAHTDNTAFTSAFSRSRVTCGGFSYLPTNTPESSQGTISFLSMANEQVGAYDGLSLATIGSDSVTCEIDEPVYVHVHNYSLPMFYSTHTYTEHYPSTLIVLRGCKASTNVGQLKMVLNVEAISSPASVHAGASTVEPYDQMAINNGTHVQQAASDYSVVAAGKQGPRRLTSTGRAVVDASAALAGMYAGGVGGAAIARSPQKYRELRRLLKAALAERRKPL